MSRSPRPCGFTLIELLVVLSLIALLVALLMPSLASARQVANQVRCLANLSQIVRGQMTYTADNKDFLFAYFHYNAPATPVNPLSKQALPYGIELGKLPCPTAVQASAPLPAGASASSWHDPVNGSYAINVNSGWYRTLTGTWFNNVRPRMLSAHKRPSQESNFLDRGGRISTADSDPYYIANYALLGHTKYSANLHNNGFNAVYLDGHASHHPASFLTTLGSVDNVFWGDPNLW